MLYLILGEDSYAKDNKIIQIKASILVKPESHHFDFESLDAQHLSGANLKKALLALPVMSNKRLLLIRHAHQLKSEAIKVLEAFVAEKYESCDVILEAIDTLKADFKNIVAQAQTSHFGVTQESNIFDMTKLMTAKKTTDALKILNEFFDEGMYPLQMMGALVWYWGKEGRMLGPQKFQRGLKALEEADLNIKRSRLMPEYAMEKLVVELVELQK